MSDLYNPMGAFATNRYRAQTEGHASMAGVTTPMFKCKKCGGSKPTQGRKQVSPGYPQDGYLCAGCAK